VRYLLERFGAVRYREFASSLLSLSDQITIRRVFHHVYGVSLDDVIEHWRITDPASSTLIVPVDVAECHDPISPVGLETWGMDDIVPDGCASGPPRTARRTCSPIDVSVRVTTPVFAIHVAGEAARSAVPAVDHTP
jgi:hypothetical protein